jgi:hypothetical protein
MLNTLYLCQHIFEDHSSSSVNAPSETANYLEMIPIYRLRDKAENGPAATHLFIDQLIETICFSM